MGQVIGGIVAETQAQAQKAAQLVRVTYEDLPRIITIEVKCSLLHGFYISDAKGGGFSFFFFFFCKREEYAKGESRVRGGDISRHSPRSCLPVCARLMPSSRLSGVHRASVGLETQKKMPPFLQADLRVSIASRLTVYF